MKILSIDTSSNICGVAVLENKELLKEHLQDTGLTHSETLMPIIQNVLSSLNLALTDIDLIICDKGPGSFTGIRIGVATAKAFADSINIKSIGISSLEALAYNVKTNGLICSLIDAKKENVYSGIFENIDGKYILRRNLCAENIFELLKELQTYTYPITFVGDGCVTYRNEISKILPNSIFVENNNLSAFNLGLAGLNHFNNNIFDDMLPLYLRKPQAERIFEEKKEFERRNVIKNGKFNF